MAAHLVVEQEDRDAAPGGVEQALLKRPPYMVVLDDEELNQDVAPGAAELG